MLAGLSTDALKSPKLPVKTPLGGLEFICARALMSFTGACLVVSICVGSAVAQNRIEASSTTTSICTCPESSSCPSLSCGQLLGNFCFDCSVVLGQIFGRCNTGCNSPWFQARLNHCGCPPSPSSTPSSPSNPAPTSAPPSATSTSSQASDVAQLE